MLRKSLQQTISRAMLYAPKKSLSPTSYRLFSTSLAYRQESEAMKPTSDSLGFESAAVKQAGRPIYLDMQATSPMDPRVLDAMVPYMTELYGNPHSRTHKYGWETEEAVEKAREVKDL
jgi:cysteine desulfurase